MAELNELSPLAQTSAIGATEAIFTTSDGERRPDYAVSALDSHYVNGVLTGVALSESVTGVPVSAQNLEDVRGGILYANGLAEEFRDADTHFHELDNRRARKQVTPILFGPTALIFTGLQAYFNSGLERASGVVASATVIYFGVTSYISGRRMQGQVEEAISQRDAIRRQAEELISPSPENKK